jgi:hypothetical protein
MAASRSGLTSEASTARADHLDQFVALRHDPRQLLFEVAALGALLFASRGEFSFAMAVLL